jgi:predicted TIM-barrel fold metal-dependent hydrolase
MAATRPNNQVIKMHNKIIDPHVHFFNLIEGEYTWLQGDTPPPWPHLDQIKAPITANELMQYCSFELTALVHIEAGFNNNHPIEELIWLNKYLAHTQYKAIGYAKIDDCPDTFTQAIAHLLHPSLVGIRDITEGEDSSRLLNPNTVTNLAYLAKLGLHFEAQFELENTTISKRVADYCAQLPNLRIVINHAGLPKKLNDWKAGVEVLTHNQNVFIKYSGFELLPLSTVQQQTCFDFIVQQFGQSRIMFASNFPVCQIKQSYEAVWQSHFALCKNHTLWRKLSYDNALRFYWL